MFIAALNRRRQGLWTDALERLRASVGEAVEILSQSVEGEDVKAAIEVLKAVGLHGAVGTPQGLTDPEAILQARAQAQARRELGDESPLQATLRGLDGGHHDRISARSVEILAELREPFCDILD